MERTIVFYHGNCPDGFGGAYAAWKKFGNAAEYVGLDRDDAPPTGLSGATVYFIDFCYAKEEMDRIASEAKRIIVLDHHEGVADVIRSMPEYRYETKHSGAVIAWQYFHPDAPVPALLRYVEDGDLYVHALPHAHEVLSYAYMRPFTFESWDALAAELDSPEGFARAAEVGKAYAEHSTYLVTEIARRAELVSFEGFEVYLASCSKLHASFVGNTLAKKKGPLALVTTARARNVRVSMRGDGSVDLTKIAQKYGGNGHPNAAAFSIPYGVTPPWTPIDEGARH